MNSSQQLSGDLLLAVSLAYVAILFLVAFIVDRRARQGRAAWLHSPVVFTLSISVYCTSWTFYGAVGSAARNGLEFITIYLGPTLVFVGWWWLLRKLVRIGREYRITSIADLISSRYGKSPSLAVLVTAIAVIATTPYIALQLQSVTRSYEAIVGASDPNTTAFLVAAAMAVFTILFGTRNLDANERHHGVVAAIAIEAIVKLFALLAVGLFVVYGVAGGVGAVFEGVPSATISGAGEIFDARWVTLTFLSATAIICLPRQFQVTVVENVDERHLATASWLFPLYLFGMCLFVMPIAIAGLKFLPADANPDLYVLTLPLSLNRQDLALLAYLGGFSSATSMVIVASIAVSTMVSNHIVMPIALTFMSERQVTGDVRRLLLISRRISIAAVLGLGYLYFRLSGGSDALAAIGLIAFVGVAQFLPSLLGGLFWRGATRSGALCGLTVGLVLWAYTLFLPSFGPGVWFSAAALLGGPYGIGVLTPQALFGLIDMDPLVHAVVWSVGGNVVAFLLVSVFSEARPLERLQAALFVDVYKNAAGDTSSYTDGQANSEDLFVLAQRILGSAPARALFDELAAEQGSIGQLPYATDVVVLRVERRLAGAIGAASAHAMVRRIAGRQSISMDELFDIADEAQRVLEASRQLAEKSDELGRTATQLREANTQLRSLDARKDDFLSQVSHELRTPMTSIRSFSEILLQDGDVSGAERQRFIGIINEESQRLTRLLDEILDVSALEAGTAEILLGPVDPKDIIEGALDATAGLLRQHQVEIERGPLSKVVMVLANADRARQVLINLLSNAVKYNRHGQPLIRVLPRAVEDALQVDIIDNGGGVAREEAGSVFEKFNRGSRSDLDRGAGLGLAISRAIMRQMHGNLTIEFAADGTSFFRVRFALTVAPLPPEV